MLAFDGVHAILVTPFSQDGTAIDHAMLGEHVERLVTSGVQTLVADGNTSEYHSLTRGERLATLRTIADAARSRATVVAGVGGTPAEVADEARAARTAGAQALMVHTPPAPFLTSDGWIRYHDLLAAAVDVPLLPYVRAAGLEPRTIASLASRSYVAAVKYANPDVVAFATASGLVPDGTHWICGLAETWAPAFWVHGAVGFTSGLVNVLPAASLALHHALATGDVAGARRLWRPIRAFESLRTRSADGYNVAVVKAAMRMTGRDPGPVRPPASDIPDAWVQEVADALDAIQGVAT
jgi:4-hydroxy-tetrahydrodipicolinate synthase